MLLRRLIQPLWSFLQLWGAQSSVLPCLSHHDQIHMIGGCRRRFFFLNYTPGKTLSNFVPILFVVTKLHLRLQSDYLYITPPKHKKWSMLTQFAILRNSLSSHSMIRRQQQQPLIDHSAYRAAGSPQRKSVFAW